MKHKAFKYIILLFTLILSLSSCKKEKSYWDDNIVAPIAHGGLSLSSLFPDTVIKSNADSSLKIGFETTLINYQLDSLLKIPDTTTVVKDTLPFNPSPSNPVLIHPGDVLFSVDISNPSQAENYYNLPNGIQLKLAIIKQGMVQIKMENTIRQPIAYHYKLLSATKNNVILDTTFHIPGGSLVSGSLSNPGISNANIDLSGYEIDLKGINHNKFNTLIETYTITIDNNAWPVDSIFYRQGFRGYFTFKSLIPQYALGYFGNQMINVGPDTTTFDIFNTIKSGMLNLNSATIKLKIENGFGVSMRANIGNLTAISTANNTVVAINPTNSTPLATPINVNPAINTGSGASASTKTITLNNTNSTTLTSFIGILPEKIAYALSAQINPPPGGNSSLGNDFGYYGTAFKAYMDADIPLYFSASNIALGDTVKFDLSGLSQIHNVNRGQLILTATNGYPFSINLQGYLLDENKQQIDVLFASPNTIDAPALDANLKVVAPLQSKLYVPITTDKINKIQKAHYIYYKATFNTTPASTQVKFYNYYNLDLLLTADINYTIGK